MTVPIAQPQIGEEAKERVRDVLDSGYLADGDEVRAFEREFAEYSDAAHGIGTANGTTALHAALAALGIGPGDTVLTTPFSFVATANAVRFVGAEPVFADIDPETYNLDPDAAETVARDQDVAAIMPVHLYGHPAEMDAFQDLGKDLGVPVIEDAAQAHGAEFNGEPVGTLGDLGCFSFYPTKNMTTGEGGMVVTDDDTLATRLRKFINHGRNGTYEHDELGHNFRMTSIAAAIGRSQLDRLPAFTAARRENATELNDHLADASVHLPVEETGCRHVYHQYTIRTADRDRLKQELEENGISAAVYYPQCIHEQPLYAGGRFPVAERAADEVLSLPVHPGVSPEDIERIAEVIQHDDD